jgi:hypothetical protein
VSIDGRGSDELLGGYRLCGESALEAAEGSFELRQDLDLRRVLARLNGDAIPLRRDAILGRSLLVCAATAYACIGLSHAVVTGLRTVPLWARGQAVAENHLASQPPPLPPPYDGPTLRCRGCRSTRGGYTRTASMLFIGSIGIYCQ